MKNRAITVEQKRQVIESLFNLWIKYPELRLGQLIENCITKLSNTNDKPGWSDPPLYFIEDFDLFERVDRFYKLRVDPLIKK